MGFIKTYFRQKLGLILFSAACVVVFAVVFILYNLPVAAVLYPAAICAVFACICLIWDILRKKSKHMTLLRVGRLPSQLVGELPQIRCQDDADYQAIINTLCDERRRMIDETDMRYRDMIDYYTVWAHQIKTPIAAMRLTLQDEDSLLCRQLSEQLQRIEQYVDMVLAFLRLDSNSKDYVFKVQQLDPIVRCAVKKFADQFIRKKLRLDYRPTQAQVLTDDKWLAFVIEQVLSNALKYTEQGSIAVYIEEPLTLCVRDSGIGIAPEDLPRVFEKSYTGYNGRRDKKASGLGLYLCKRICDSLGHGISIQSAPGRGTVVKIRLHREELVVE